MSFERPDRGSGAGFGKEYDHDDAALRLRQRRRKQFDDVTATTTNSIASTVATATAPPETADGVQRRRLQRQARQFAYSVGASSVILIFAAIPLSVLACMALLTCCWGGLLYTLYQRALFEYQTTVINGEGLGRLLLSEETYNQLVHTSLHEYMMGSPDGTSIINEYAYLGIYFMPGLTPESIERYINRLVPRHRRYLRQRGLAQHIPYIGNGMMRFLIGQRRYDQLDLGNPRRAAARALPAPEDDQSLDSITHTSGASDEEGATVSRGVVARAREILPRTIDTLNIRGGSSSEDEHDDDDDDEEDEDLDGEALVLSDALADGLTNLSSLAVNFALASVQQLSSQSARLLARYLQRASTLSALASVTVGVAGLRLGVYRPNTRRDSARLPPLAAYFPAGTFVISTFLASGLTAGIVRTVMNESKPADADKKDDGETTKDK